MSKNAKNESLLLGDEAVGFAAIDAGLTGIFGYPGTPSTEVFEAVEAEFKKNGVANRVARWAANEKVGYEFALGCSYIGKRSMVTMKHVGLNVAMDPFVNSAITGVNGGLVVVVADDPGMHSSQNEQDSRYLADFANLPCLEPSTPQEAYDFTTYAFELSEKLRLPVLLRLVTRLAHTRGVVARQEMKEPTDLGIPNSESRFNWVLIPSNARLQYQRLRDNFGQLLEAADDFNKFKKGDRRGVVVSGMGKANFDQLCKEEATISKFSKLEVMAYPLNDSLIDKMLESCDEIYIFEENYPYIEDKFIAKTRQTKIRGRRDGTLNIAGELDPGVLRQALKLSMPEKKKGPTIDLPARPPRMCDGCGHIDAYNAMKEAFNIIGVSDPRVFGDIGCYTLGAQPPFEGIDTCVEMGASLGMALGAAMSGQVPSVGVIGDSTFFHSGLPTLISLVESKVNANFVIMDNRITAMTGQQEVVATDIIPQLAQAAGLLPEQVHILTPLPKKHEENVKKLVEIFKNNRPDLIIFKRDCIQAMRKGLYAKINEEKKAGGHGHE
ncbi:MAG: hypothetical protein A2504_15545 [Bdellovibrionales bacterium RIFOXYD12_FULL_39_22]|nr:MAG: hypothetical protein A2385_02975 [Bdellovibrionales bacterium RIFOXYB1_FULL_39_21]OFZ43207.1 MAG: hypothetical protein A2485_12120 [Bdellovibrionales bacterium RIFOXYC12_FULL_39_17]OFZ47945.1 MAG: hypothetical protein A2404_16760 [Bdellovibrionales bacterium RIFOXYC1_FULL_39_130]OFZ71650.1 MAG: hypothetical protein A2451_11070 [Bdellovibrionales bacterium RIFOXYC2_FULL_39_8]OFZ75725.1 MAG: hypothetical protein A2560_13260 [Bdellovibrionales bacterium RIFOXYD1_FULL_39_84]OFZ94215.1 MAG: